MAGQTINVSILADTKKFSSAMRNLSKESGLDKLGATAKRAGKAVAVGLAAAGAATAALGVKAVRSASDLEQSIGAVDAIFKGNADQVHAWAKSASGDLGLARNEYSELASLIGAQLKNGGTALDELGGKTNDLVGVGADLSAQFGGSTREAVEALSSALKGERDPIERYGVSLNQAKIDAEAAALGFEKVGGSLSTEAQQAATLSLIMKQTSDAHGAFARESNTLAGQTQRLKANFENLSASAGTVLLPVLTSLVAWANDRVVPALARFGNGLRGVWDVLVNGNFSSLLRDAFGWEEDSAAVDFLFTLRERGIELADTFTTQVVPALQDLAGIVRDDVVPVLRDFGDWIAEHKGEIAAVTAAVVGFAAGFGAVLKIQAAIATIHAIRGAIVALNAAMLANPIALTVAAIAALVAGLVVFFTQTETGRQIWESVWPRIQEVAQAFTDWFVGTALPVLQAAWESIKAAALVVVDWFTTTAWPALQAAWQGIQDAAAAAADWYMTYVAPIFSAAGELIGEVIGLLQERWAVAWGAIQAVWGVVGGPLMSQIQNAVIILQGIWAVAWNTISALVGAAFAIIKTTVEAALQVIAGIIRAITAAIRGDWSAVWSEVQGILSTVWGAIRDNVATVTSALWDIISGNLQAIYDTWVRMWDRVKEKVTTAWDAVKSTTSRKIEEVLTFFRNMPGRITSALGSLGSLLSGAARDVIDGFVGGLRAGFQRVRDTLSSLTNLLPDWKGPAAKDRNILRGAGRLVIGGFVGGMEDEYGTVRRSLARLTQDVASTAFDAPTVPATAAAGGPGRQGTAGEQESTDSAILQALASLIEAIRSMPERFQAVVQVDSREIARANAAGTAQLGGRLNYGRTA